MTITIVPACLLYIIISFHFSLNVISLNIYNSAIESQISTAIFPITILKKNLLAAMNNETINVYIYLLNCVYIATDLIAEMTYHYRLMRRSAEQYKSFKLAWETIYLFIAA